MHKPFNVRDYAKSSTAYAAAVTLADEELTKINGLIFNGGDCRDANWVDAEEMARLALRLQELREQFSKSL